MPKKEEFPTFLNEQPTIIFGRTGRQLLIIVLGIVGATLQWSYMEGFQSTTGWQVLSGTLAAIPVLLSLVIALIPIADRGMEEWVIVWLLYAVMPRIYLYVPVEEEVEVSNEEGDELNHLPPPDPDELED
jgi:hypothetical protein